MPRTLFLAAVSALALGAAAPAFGEQYETVSTVVHFGDLDIYSNTGAATLLERIDHAARRVCDDNSVRRPIAEQSNEVMCRDQAEEQAVSDLNNPVVTAQYYGVTPEVVISEEDRVLYPDGALVVKKPVYG